MQQFFSFTLFLLLFNLSLVQAQTISYSEETGELAAQQLVDAKNCFFKNQESVSHIWKLNVADFLNTEVNFLEQIIELETGLGIGYEQRLKTGWSLNFNLDGSLFTARINHEKFNLPAYLSNLNHIVKKIGFSIAPRWYFKKKKQVKKGLSGDNLSGIYAGLQFGVDLEQSATDYISNASNFISGVDEMKIFETKSRNILFLQTLNLGVQQQFSKNGYFDIKVGAGLSRNLEKYSSFIIDGQEKLPRQETTWKTILNYQLGLGLAIGNNERKEETPNCDVFEYHENSRRLLKLSIINPTDLLSSVGVETTLVAGIEQKIASSPFSINANLIYRMSPRLLPTFSLEFEPRYYYDLKKRQLLGKTGNGFSANYIGLRSELVFERITRTALVEKTIGIAPVWGVQRQFFKRFLFDFSAGPERLQNFINDKNGWNFFSELRLGVAF